MGQPARRLILASGSRGRRELLAMHGYEFEVRPSQIDEPTEARLGDCRHYVAELAWLKAAAVAREIDEGIVIAADTVGWHAGRVIGKPDDAEHARSIIASLQGTTHELWPGDRQVCWQELSRVAMVPLSDRQIHDYLETRLWEGCSGAYAIQFPVDPYLTVIEGSTSNVIGLPMESLAKALADIESWQ